MPEPTTPTAAALAATASGITMALLGVDYYSLIWAMFGAMFALYQTGSVGRVGSVVFVALSTLVGAAVAGGLMAMLDSKARPLMILFGLLGGFGSQAVVNAMLAALVARINKAGGQ